MSSLGTVTVNGSGVTVLAGSMSIEQRIEERSVAQFVVIDKAASLTFTEGMPVAIYDDTPTLLFAGFIDTPTAERAGDWVLHSLACRDNHYLADKRLVVESYTSKTAAYIINDLITNYLTDEGITAGTIQTGPTVEEAIFNYASASACMDSLKELSGFLWQINPDKSLDFLQRDTNAAPWALTVSEIASGSAKQSKGNPLYRNRQFVRGGSGLTSQQTETHVGNGFSKTFSVGYPVGATPTVTVDAVSQTVGVKGVDSGRHCYWASGDPVITFDVAPVSHTAIVVIYYGQYPLITRADSATSITSKKAIEGGTGIVENIAHEEQHSTAAAMKEAARTKLQLYCQDAARFKFETRTVGLKAGQLLAVTYSPFGYSSQDMLIEEVVIKTEDATRLVYSVSAITGPVLGSWSRFFSNILARQDKSVKVGDSLLLVLLQAPETLEVTESSAVYTDSFAGGVSGRWLNAAPIDSGSLCNVRHEGLTVTESPATDTGPTENYFWG